MVDSQVEHELSDCRGTLVYTSKSVPVWEPGNGGWVEYKAFKCVTCKSNFGERWLVDGEPQFA